MSEKTEESHVREPAACVGGRDEGYCAVVAVHVYHWCVMGEGNRKRCPHGKRKDFCVGCNPCPHGKLKRDCVDCNPCPHGRLKRFCVGCKPCPHGKVKDNCADCNPCPHGKLKR